LTDLLHNSTNLSNSPRIYCFNSCLKPDCVSYAYDFKHATVICPFHVNLCLFYLSFSLDHHYIHQDQYSQLKVEAPRLGRLADEPLRLMSEPREPVSEDVLVERAVASSLALLTDGRWAYNILPLWGNPPPYTEGVAAQVPRWTWGTSWGKGEGCDAAQTAKFGQLWGGVGGGGATPLCYIEGGCWQWYLDGLGRHVP